MRRIALAFCYIILLGLTGCGGSGGSPNTTSVVETTAITGGTFGTGKFVVTVAANSIPTSANAAPVATALSAIPSTVIVKSYETNVTSGAKAYTLKIGSANFNTSSVGSVKVEVPFDRTLVPDQGKIDSLHLLIRILNADDNSVINLTGQIVGDKIVADLTGFPSSATVTALFNPNMEAVTSSSTTAKSAQLSSSTWSARNWVAIIDTVEVIPEVQKFLHLNSTPSLSQIRTTIKEQIADHAADAATIYAGQNFRSPTLYVAKTAAEPGGLVYGTTPRYIIHFQKEQSANFTPKEANEFVDADNNHYGRIYIKDTDLNNTFSGYGMAIYGCIAHELFHAVQAGYELSGKPELKGVREGTATAYGAFLDRRHDGDLSAVPQVRQLLTPAVMIKAETFKLENSLLVNVRATGGEAYSNQDFFVYLAHKIGNNNFSYLATLFEDIFQNNIRTFEALYKAFDSFLLSYDTNLLKVYGQFVQQRAVEHSDASLFGRPGETTSGLAKDLFNYYAGITSLKEVQIDPTSTSILSVNDLNPMKMLSARVIKLTPMAGKTKGDITVTVAPTKGAFGTTLSGWIYRQPNSAATRTVTPLLASNTITGFGEASSDEVIILMINPSFDTSGVGITCEIKGTPASGIRFIDKGNGTIYDSKTNMTWVKNNRWYMSDWDGYNSFASAMASGLYGLSDGSKAGDWRVPTLEEMLALTNDAYQIEALIAAGFVIEYKFYWTSSTATGGAWCIRFAPSPAINYPEIARKDSTLSSLLVRTGQ